MEGVKHACPDGVLLGRGIPDYIAGDDRVAAGLGRLNNHLRVKIRTWGASHTHVAIREIEWEFDRV